MLGEDARAQAGGYDSYVGFWASISDVTVSDVSADGDVVTAQLTYTTRPWPGGRDPAVPGRADRRRLGDHRGPRTGQLLSPPAQLRPFDTFPRPTLSFGRNCAVLHGLSSS